MKKLEINQLEQTVGGKVSCFFAPALGVLGLAVGGPFGAATEAFFSYCWNS